MPTLNWLDRPRTLRQSARVPCRLLRADDALSCGDRGSGNMLIQGDNLHALKALLPYFRGQVKCVFIDPPYNTKSAFEHYSDSLEHSKWLDMMVPRLELLRELLAEDGSIWVTIDDHEAHYLKVVMDEIFGRGNFVGNIIWEKSDSPRMDAQFLSSRHDNLTVYSKNIEKTVWNWIPSNEIPSYYDKKDKSGRIYYLKPLRAMGGQGDSRATRPTLYFPLIAPDGSEVFPVRQDGADGAWRWKKSKVDNEKERIDWVRGRNGWTPYYRIYANENSMRPPETIWSHQETGSNRASKSEIKKLFPDLKPFGTPKPESLLQRIVHISTNPGDLVLDSFLGSGTTAAVAHKMNRRYIGIELGEHAKTHCAVRLQKVVAGEQGGISKAVNWQGGGFRFYTLGTELFGADGQIHPEVKFADLAAYLWFMQTRTPYRGKADSPLLGVHNDTAYYLLYNGILKDRSVNGGNVLTRPLLNSLPAHDGKRVIFANSCRLGEKALLAARIEFQQIPWAVQRIGKQTGGKG